MRFLFYITVLLLCFTTFSQSPKKLYKLGLEFEEAQNCEDAIHAYSLAVHLDTNFNYVYENLGKCHFKKKEWNKSIETYSKLKTPLDTLTYYKHFAHAYYKTSEFSLADKYYALYLMLSPKDSVAQYEQGFTSYQLMYWKASSEHLEEAIHLGYSPDDTKLLLARALTKQNRSGKAIKSYELHLEQFPQDSSARIEQAYCYQENNQLDLATKGFLSLNNKPDSIQYLIAQNYFEVKEFENALNYYSTLEPANSSNSLYLEIANCHYNLNAFEDALTYYQKSKAIDYAPIEIEIQIALCLEEQGDFETAVKHYSNYLKEIPNNKIIRYRRGLAYFKEYDWHLALEDFEHLFTWQSKPDQFNFIVGTNYLEIRLYQQSIHFLNKHLKKSPNDHEALLKKIIANASLFHNEEAVADLINLDISDHNEEMEFGFILNRQLNDSAKHRFWNTAIKNSPENPTFHFFIGLNSKQKKMKKSHYLRAQKLDSSLYEPNFLLGQLYLQQNCYDSAYYFLNKAKEIIPKNLTLYKEINKCLEMTENHNLAINNGIEYLSQALSTLDSAKATHLIAKYHLLSEQLDSTFIYEIEELRLWESLDTTSNKRNKYFELLVERAKIAYKNKQYIKALYWFEKNCQFNATHCYIEEQLFCLDQLKRRENACLLIKSHNETDQFDSLKTKYCE